MDQHLIDLSRLRQIKILYNLTDEQLGKPPEYPSSRTKRLEDCKSHLGGLPLNLRQFITDPQYELVAPKRVGHLDDAIRKVIVNGLATRFCVQPNVARKFLPEAVEQWGKLRRLEGGDIMHADRIVTKRMDGRDASFVRVCELLHCQMFFETNLSPSFCDSMSNLLIDTSAIETVQKSSGVKHSSGNFSTSLSFPFPKATNLKQRSLKMFVSRLFGKFVLLDPTLKGHRSHYTHSLGPWTPLTSNPSNVSSAVLKTGENGGWLTVVARWRMRYFLRQISGQ